MGYPGHVSWGCIPLLMGWTHTEETAYDRPTPERLALFRKRVVERSRLNV